MCAKIGEQAKYRRATIVCTDESGARVTIMTQGEGRSASCQLALGKLWKRTVQVNGPQIKETLARVWRSGTVVSPNRPWGTGRRPCPGLHMFRLVTLPAAVSWRGLSVIAAE